MIEKRDIAPLMKAVANVVRDYVASVCEDFKERVASLEDRIKAIPSGAKGDQGEPGKDAAPVDVALVVAEVLKAVPAPKDGKDGRDGDPGAAGRKGDKGESIVGPQGEPGRDGKDGVDGKEGPAGSGGLNGKDGDPGINGKDGRDGIDGASGKDGQPGPIGEKGEPGSGGPAGERGEKGLDGKDGRDGREGKDGRDGEPGRDALQIEILSSVDSTKSYPRGTFASFGGGIIRATRNTDPNQIELIKAGWEVIVEGLAGIDIKQGADPREFTVTCRKTSGEKSTLSGRLPALQYQGVFSEGKSYVRGDVVNYGGSAWHCQAESTKSSPMEHSASDWKLIVKRGRDGKDGKPGESGARGLEGPAGKDLRYT